MKLIWMSLCKKCCRNGRSGLEHTKPPVSVGTGYCYLRYGTPIGSLSCQINTNTSFIEALLWLVDFSVTFFLNCELIGPYIPCHRRRYAATCKFSWIIPQSSWYALCLQSLTSLTFVNSAHTIKGWDFSLHSSLFVIGKRQLNVLLFLWLVLLWNHFLGNI